jgi:hypothetical protein
MTSLVQKAKLAPLPPLAPPHPYFGSKAEAADRIWEALGDPENFVDPFAGSASVLYARSPSAHDVPIETVGDAWGFIPNFLRAMRDAPEDVARFADWPVSELDMHARHRFLLRTVDEAFVERLRRDEAFFDAKVAGFWVWGQAIWIGSGWCVPGKEAAKMKLPHLTGAGPGERNRSPHYGRGIFRRQLVDPDTIAAGLAAGALDAELVRELGNAPRRVDVLRAYFRLFAKRLERVRITCGDYKRLLSPSITYSHGLTGILLDPPYGKEAKRMRKLYAADSLDVAAEVRAWAAANGSHPLLRIILCGYEGEHEELAALGWTAIPWKGRGGYANQGDDTTAIKERLWLSPHCIGGKTYLGPLFGQG